MELYHLSVQGSGMNPDFRQTAAGELSNKQPRTSSPPLSAPVPQAGPVSWCGCCGAGSLGNQGLSIKYAKHGNSVATSPGDQLGACASLASWVLQGGAGPSLHTRREEQPLEALQMWRQGHCDT